MADTSFDVAIIGGGLAGLTLALQLDKAAMGLSIVVLERNKLPPPVAAHKVGESTVEIGAHYLADTLELSELLERTQLRKFGLRLFFGAGLTDDLATADELGASHPLPAVSYQIDRGRFEGDLVSVLASRGIPVLDGCVVRNVTVGEADDRHTLEIRQNGEPATITSRWVVDAGSRTATLKRALGLDRACSHKIGSAWLRIDAPIAVDDWSTSDPWQQRCDRPRRLSTNHLMGPGYWVWVIPLANDRTSIGIVADPATSPLSEFNTFEKFCNWLSTNQPTLAEKVLERKADLMDFSFLNNLSKDSDQVWSRDRWALTGEAGLFTDPFYSPGSDFIGISNSFITDLIAREKSNTDFRAHVAVYQQMFKSFHANTMSLYENQYQGFGDARLMVVKTTWDYAYYWSVLTWLYFRDVMTDIDFLREIQSRLVDMRDLNAGMQKLFRQRATERRQSPGRGRYFDQVCIPVLYDLNAALIEPTDSPRKEFEENCSRLERLAPTLTKLLSDPSPSGRCELLGDLRQRLN